MSVGGTRAWIGLGANLGRPLEQLLEARRRLAEEPGNRLLACSSLYRTAPWGYREQPAFLNAVLLLETRHDADELFARMTRIEEALGRTRGGRRWGPRRIDLDLLLYGELRREVAGRLRLPHPRLHCRRFVLEPLHEVDPGLPVPGRGTVDELLAALVQDERGTGARDGCRRLLEPRWGEYPAGSENERDHHASEAQLITS